jgi:hypothetical protein
MAKIARVKPDVSGSLLDHETSTFHELDHGRDWPADHPVVVQHPDAFDLVDDTAAPADAAPVKPAKPKG